MAAENNANDFDAEIRDAEIWRYSDAISAHLPGLECRAVVRAEMDEIFFASSSVQSFADKATQQAFHWRWLGRYLAEEPQHAFVAIRKSGKGKYRDREHAEDTYNICGYLVGSLDDPARRAEFSDLSYFEDFADQTAKYPAHLHINLAPPWRGKGIGGALIAAFARHARKEGVAGMHVVTGQGMRNVSFYKGLGFEKVAMIERWKATVVMLAKYLTP